MIIKRVYVLVGKVLKERYKNDKIYEIELLYKVELYIYLVFVIGLEVVIF